LSTNLGGRPQHRVSSDAPALRPPWIRKQRLHRSLRRSATITGTHGPSIALSQRLRPELVRTPLSSTSKSEVLAELSGILARGAGVPERSSQIHEAILGREALLSTGIGRGVAVPHARSPALSNMAMAVGTTREPIDFDSVDAEPVRLVWMLVGPRRTGGLHVRTLAAISELLRDDRILGRLLGASTPGEFLRIVEQAESH